MIVFKIENGDGSFEANFCTSGLYIEVSNHGEWGNVILTNEEVEELKKFLSLNNERLD